MRRHKPVVMLGAGARGADMDRIFSWGIPILTSWPAKDMLDNEHYLYFGSPGIYGQRCANKVLHGADFILSLGNRLSIWNVGYEGIRNGQALLMVDLDKSESLNCLHAAWREHDARTYPEVWNDRPSMDVRWFHQCQGWRAANPLHMPETGTHDDTHCINSYRFTHALQKYLRHDEVIVTEMGAPLMAAHQILCLKPPQRLMTSGGLGEMGCGLPAAVGASFARNNGPVLCLSTDGGMMMNLQELATIAHHKLPVKIIVYNNGGYGMLKQTMDNADMPYAGVDEGSGVSFPNFRHLAMSFGIVASEVRTWEDYERIIPGLFHHDGPQLVDYRMDPRQKYHPKLEPVFVDGKPTSPPFDRMSPHV